jgi:hypothetical protein
VSTGSPPQQVSTTPVALRVEVLGEEGQATVVTDNGEAVRTRFTNKLDPAVTDPAPKTGCAVVDPMSLGLLFLLASLRRRRR